MKTVLVDMDGILANLQDSWYPRYNAIRPEGWPELTPESVTSWDIPQAHHPTLWSVIEQPGLYRNLKPLPGAIEGLKALYTAAENGQPRFDIYVVTSATAAPHTPTEKIQWLGEHFPFISRKKVITAHTKHIIRGDVLIDDGPPNIEGWGKVNPDKTILTIKYPYNAYCYGNNVVICGHYTHTAAAWDNIVEYLLD